MASIPADNPLPQTPSPTGRHVAMIVPNTVLIDSRVLKSAASLANAGIEVTVLGLKLGDTEELIERDGWRIRVVPFTTSAQEAANRAAGTATVAPSTIESTEEKHRPEAEIHRDLKHERMMMENRRREAAAEIGWVRAEFHQRRIDRSLGLRARKDASLKKLAERTQRIKSLGSEWPGLLGRAISTTRALPRAPYLASRAAQRLTARLPAPSSKREEEAIRQRLQTDEDAYARRRQDLLSELEELRAQWDPPSTIPDRDKWRNYLPVLHNYEAALGPVLDSLDVDAIHVHDFPLLGVGARAKGRANRRGRAVRLVYDAHEYVAGIRYPDPRKGRAWLSVEREYIEHADHIITVSDAIADRLQKDYSLPYRPSVVLNAPVRVGRTGQAPDLRKLADVPKDARVIVYSGNLQPERNVITVVRALPMLADDVHLVIVGNTVSNHVEKLLSVAEGLGVAHRIHLAPYVEPSLVPEYLSFATMAVHPMTTDSLNHQLALPNKLLEYLHAGLPELVSDNQVMAAFVKEHGIGESFSALDPADLARKATLILDDNERYRQVIGNQPQLVSEYSWDRQVPSLLGAYETLFGIELATPTRVDTPSSLTERRPRVVFLPTNASGQAWAWAKAVEARFPGLETEVVQRMRNVPTSFPCDRLFSAAESGTPSFRLAEKAALVAKTHALIESGQSMFGSLPDRSFFEDQAMYEGARVSTALVFHGSDIRDPDRHALLVSDSPFRSDEELAAQVRPVVQKVASQVKDFEGPIFISTLDLLDYVPDALWLPQVIALDTWLPQPVRIGERKPRIVMIPSAERLKGGRFADEICWRLQDAGVIDYRRLRGLSPHEMRAAIAAADVVIDGLVLGAYGTTAVEAMACQRLVIANLERVIHRQPEPPPIVNTSLDTLESVLIDMVENPDRYREMAMKGRGYAATYHDGSFAAAQLAPFLGLV